MLIRAAIILVIAGCTGSAPAPPETIDLQPEISECEPRNYPCTPNNPWSETVCDVMCGGGGFDGQGHCLAYSPVEEVWCARHPGLLYHLDPRKLCDAHGNPTWQTHCVPGRLP